MGRILTKDFRLEGGGGVEDSAGVSSSRGKVSQIELLSCGRGRPGDILDGLPVTPRLANLFGGTWGSVGGEEGGVPRRFELDTEFEY